MVFAHCMDELQAQHAGIEINGFARVPAAERGMMQALAKHVISLGLVGLSRLFANGYAYLRARENYSAAGTKA
jgi:hypothetical protein